MTLKTGSSQEDLRFTIRLFSEITIKSAPVRKRWTKLLCQNIRTLGRRIHERTAVVQEWDRIDVRVPVHRAPHANGAQGENAPKTPAPSIDALRASFIDLLGRIPGISTFSEVKAYPLVDIHGIFETCLPIWRESLEGKSFCVRVKRNGKHDFSSGDVERYVGGGLNQHVNTAGVKLKNPDVTVYIEIKDDTFFVVEGKYSGQGGFPLGTQDPVLSLVSGGFDSSVASYLMMQRGMRNHFCFFNLGGRAHEIGVKEISYFLWQRYSASHRVKFITVPFEGVVAEIMENISPANMGVVLKRMMFRAAEKIAKRAGIEALVTGEAISQVSSQTIPNLSAIDRVTDLLVLRPLIAQAKPDIIQKAREIGVEEFAANIPEYCGVISVKPSAKINLEKLEAEEGEFDFGVLDAAIENSIRQSIDEVMEEKLPQHDIQKVNDETGLPENAVIIDIRHPDEAALSPLRVSSHRCMHIPFFKLNSEFPTLPKEDEYYLFCDRGVMSELHAAHLHDEGYTSVRVYRPERR